MAIRDFLISPPGSKYYTKNYIPKIQGLHLLAPYMLLNSKYYSCTAPVVLECTHSSTTMGTRSIHTKFSRSEYGRVYTLIRSTKFS